MPVSGERANAVEPRPAVKSGVARERPKLLYLVTEDWFFATHFFPMVRAARGAGFDVVVATRVRDHAAQIEREGCRIIPFENERKRIGPLEVLRTVARLIGLVRAERPDAVHCIALRMVVLGGLAARSHLSGVSRSIFVAPLLEGPTDSVVAPIAPLRGRI